MNRGLKWDRQNPERANARKRKYWSEMKPKILAEYGLTCARCGFADIRALSIDHINNDGYQHLKKIGKSRFYPWLIKNKFPAGFQTLCMNCQFIKSFETRQHKQTNLT